MESSLALKPQALSLITRAPICSPLSPPRVGLLRCEFLGCGHSLRLQRRRRCRKLKFKFHSNYCKFLFKASLESQPILVVAATAAAVSAITTVYMSYSGKEFNLKEMSGRLALALSEQIRSMSNWFLMDSHQGDLTKETSVDVCENLVQETRENNQVYKTRVAEIKSVKTRGTLNAEASMSHLNMVGLSVEHCLASGTVNMSEIPSPSSVLSVYNFPSATEVSEVHNDVNFKPNSDPAELSVPISHENLNATTSTPVHSWAGADDVRVKFELLNESDISSLHFMFRNKDRDDLYTINASSLEKLDKSLDSCATVLKTNAHNSIKNSLARGSNRIALDAVYLAEKSKEKVHLEHYSQGLLFQHINPKDRKEFRKKVKTNMHQDRPRKLSPSSNPKGNENDENRDPSWQLRVYEQFLREGRLKDCIELLEDLEKNSLLDMNKVYHGRFFEVCKTQRAVKEAFRFTRLIPNPTLSTFNMLMSVCASSQDTEGAFQVLQHVQGARLNADCKLYTTLISTCAKSGKVDTMFKVFHEMINAGVEPNVHTYGALIDGCAKAGQVAKAFGAYGILRSKDVKPDRVIFNALITACGQSGAVDRAFDVLAEMRAEAQPIDPDHVTIGALMKACASAGQVDRAREVYDMIHKYGITGTAELYTIAVNSCSHHGDWEFACSVYHDMIRKNVAPDEMFISALIDVAGHAAKVDAAFEILEEARAKGMHIGIISYSSLMGACCNARDYNKALELYQDVKGLHLKPTVSMMNALITSLCDADQLQKAMEILFEMKSIGLCPNTITYSILLVASEKKDDIEAGLMVVSEAKKDGVTPNLVMCRCLIAMCLRRFQKASTFGEPVLSFTSGQVQLNSKWTSLALMVYRETITAGVTPTMDELSQVLGCLQIPHDVSVRNRLVESLGVNTDTLKGAKRYSRIDGFGEYDPRSFSLVEEAASLGVVPSVSLKESPIVVDARNFQVHTAEVYILTVLKGLKHRLAAGAKLPNLNILLPLETTQIETSAGKKTIKISGRISQAVAALLRRLGLSYQGNESYGKIRINGVNIRKWFQPKRDSPLNSARRDMSSSLRHLGSGIARQRSKIRTGHLSLE